MKLRKILASFLAGAVALTSTVVTSVTASAEDTVVCTNVAVAGSFDGDGGLQVDLQNSWGNPINCDDYSRIEMVYDVTDVGNATAFGIAINGNSCGWKDSTNWNLAAGTDQILSIDFSALAGKTFEWVGYKAYGTAGDACSASITIKSVTLYSADTTVYSWQTLEIPTPDANGNYCFPGYFVPENINGPSAGIEITITDSDAANWGGFNIVDNTGGAWTKITGDFGEAADSYTKFVRFDEFTGNLPTTAGVFFISAYNGASLSSVRIKNDSTKDPVYVVPAPTYAINIADTENGSVVAKVDGATVTEAEEGAIVTLEITPDAGYEVDTIAVTGGAVPADSDSFEMPAGNVTVTVTFMPIEVQSVDVSPENVTLVVGDSIQLVAEVTPTDALDQTLTWSSDEPTIASVDQNGKVTALEEGFAVITAEASNGVLNTVTVNVTADSVPATAIELISTELDTVVGDMNNIGAGLSIEPADCTDVPVWTTSDPDVATVTADGKVTSIGAGSATITVTVGSLTATCIVNVEEPAPEPSGFDLTKPEFKLNIATMQTAIEEDGEKSLRFVCMKTESDLEGVSQVDFELRLYVDGEFYGTATISSEYYYTSLVASGETVTAPEGCVFIAITINNVPATHDIECYRITY